jgi:hypothetical protein
MKIEGGDPCEMLSSVVHNKLSGLAFVVPRS